MSKFLFCLYELFLQQIKNIRCYKFYRRKIYFQGKTGRREMIAINKKGLWKHMVVF